MNSHSILQIDLHIIKQNYLKLRELVSVEVGATLKADAYGLGATQIATVVADEGCKTFFAANIQEAYCLKEKFPNIEVFFYNGFTKGEEKIIAHNNILPVISNLYQIEIFNNFCISNNMRHKIAIHVETGMNRLSMPYEEILRLASDRDLYSNLDIEYIISHLASAEDYTNDFNVMQLERFKQIVKLFPGIKCSLANSAGILLGSEYHFDIVRPGAALYGINTRENMSLFGNPVKLISPLLQIKCVRKGESLGYNQTYVANKDTWIGTIPLGYADGVFRSLSNNGYCYINDKQLPIIGRVSMDLVNIDLSNLDESQRYIGQEINIICEHQTPDQLGSLLGTIGYEIITALGNRYERRYTR